MSCSSTLSECQLDLSPHARTRRACLWMAKCKTHDAIQQQPVLSPRLWLAQGFLQPFPATSCLQAVERKIQRGPLQVATRQLVTALQPAPDAASRSLLFSRRDRIVLITNPITPAIGYRMQMVSSMAGYGAYRYMIESKELAFNMLLHYVHGINREILLLKVAEIALALIVIFPLFSIHTDYHQP